MNEKQINNIENESVFRFLKFLKKPIAIYGTGNNAEFIVKNIKDFNFECIISVSDFDKDFHGIPIVSLEEAIKRVKAIIIAATPSSTSIVFNRIYNKVPSFIDIYDMRGKKLIPQTFQNIEYWDENSEKLKRLINNYDVISFDIFDTLIMRKTLSVDDLWIIVQEKLSKKNINIPFVKMRRNAENIANQKISAPSIEYIYKILKEQNNLADDMINVIKKLEIQTDMDNIIPRYEMNKILQYAKEKEKTIVFTSDMYYSMKQIISILKKNGINVPRDIFISCEMGGSKVDGVLFKKLKLRFAEKNILHIGDNYEYDFKNAKKYGIDSYWIMGHCDLFSFSSISSLLDYHDWNSRKILGYISSKLFNNPFCICETKGKLEINTYEKLAILFLTITLMFMKYIEQQSENYNIILFPSRDGFFLYKAFRKINKLKSCSIYFYTSRSGISSATAKNENEIKLLCDKLWIEKRQNIKRFVENQFQIDVDESFDLTVEEALEKYDKDKILNKILQYKEEILDKCLNNHNNYMKYIKEIGILDDEKIAVIDIVTHGTLIKGISDLIQQEIDLIALGTSNIPNRYIDDIKRVKSIYGNINVTKDYMQISLSDLSELHLLIEILYSSWDGQFLRFDENGKPLFLKDSEYDIELLKKFQLELMKLIQEIYEDFSDEINKSFALDVLNSIRGEKSIIADEMRDRFVFNDPYDDEILNTNILYKINKR